MKLYHGTSSRHLGSVLKEGLKPRGRKKGNWKSFPSRKDMVYLTNAYAPFFAIQGSKGKEKALVLEIDTDLLDFDRLYPDEDFIAQALAYQTKRPLDEVHEEVKKELEGYQHLAMDSLERLGNCSHKGGVPASAISRYCLIDCVERADIGMMSMDPSISIMNYKFCGSKYRSVISWLFGDRDDFELGFGGNEVYIEMMEKCRPGFGKEVAEMFSNRKGIEVFKGQGEVPCVTRQAV